MTPAASATPGIQSTLRRSAICILALQALWLPLSHVAALWSFAEPTPDHAVFQLGYRLANLLGVMEGEFLIRSGAPVVAFLGVAFLLFAAMTSISLNAIRVLRARASELRAADISKLTGWTFSFAILPMAMLPNGPGDFWVYTTWTRMFAVGLSPYYALPGDVHTQDLLVGQVEAFNPYGPLWSTTALVLGKLAQGNLWAELLFAKAWAAACWCGLLALLRYATREQPLYDQAMALIWFGWLPASWLFVIGEGHNDILLALGVVGWLALLRRGHARYATLPLIASVLAKYVSLPFLALDAWIALRAKDRSPGQYFAVLGAGLAAGALLFAAFTEGDSLFNAHLETQRLRALSPSFAARRLLVGFGFHAPAKYYDVLVSALILVPAVPAGLRFLRAPRFEDAALLVLAALVFAFAVPLLHTWPWYTTWFLPVAALIWRTGYARAVLPIVLLAPLANACWWYWQWSTPLTILWWTAYPVVLLGLVRSRLLTPPSGESQAASTDRS